MKRWTKSTLNKKNDEQFKMKTDLKIKNKMMEKQMIFLIYAFIKFLNWPKIKSIKYIDSLKF